MRLALLTIWLIISPCLAEETETLESIQQARKKLLESIVTYQEQAFEVHRCSVEELIRASIELYHLQRNAATNLEEKQQFQQKIVVCKERLLAHNEKRHQSGNFEPGMVEILRGRERILAAHQKLLKIEAQLQAKDASGN